MSELASIEIRPHGFRRLAKGVMGYLPAAVGLVVLGLIILASVFAPLIARYDPRAVTSLLTTPPSGAHWLGTDVVGKDVFSNLVYGGRISLTIGLMTGVGVFVIGVVVGATAGYFGGKVDSVLMRITEVFQVIPSLVLALVAVATLGRGIYYTALAITLAIWPQVARIVRAQFLSIKTLDMVAAAQTIGFRSGRIIFVEILPLALPAIIVQVTIDIGSAILIESGLSFLGLGDPNLPSWGTMLQTAQADLSAWWMSVPPGLAILVVVLAINFVGDGFNHAVRPSAQENL